MMFLSVVMRYKLPNSGCMSRQSLLQSLMGGTDVIMGWKSSMKLSWEVRLVHRRRIWMAWREERKLS